MSTLQSLAIVKIGTERNVRDKVDDLAELTASIKAHGVLQPITVRPGDAGDYVVLWGHRRLAAALLAGLTEIPAIVRADLDVVDRASVQLVENLLREDLSPLEEAAGYKRLIELGLSQAGVAAKVGRSQPHVSKRLALLALPKKLREQVHSGGITIEAALEPKREKRAPKPTAAKPPTEKPELLLSSTPSMDAGQTVIDQCAQCGALVAHHAKKLGACPACSHGRWWRQTLPVGPFTTLEATAAELEAAPAESAQPIGEPVSQHVCRSCGCHGDCADGCVWTEMVEIGFLCSNCESAAAKPVAEKAGPVDQRVRV